MFANEKGIGEFECEHTDNGQRRERVYKVGKHLREKPVSIGCVHLAQRCFLPCLIEHQRHSLHNQAEADGYSIDTIGFKTEVVAYEQSSGVVGYPRAER